MILRAQQTKSLTLPPVRPNAGVGANYARRLDAMVEQMHKSVLYWITANYRANTPELAQDASPAVEMQKAMTLLARRWTTAFNKGAQELAVYFADSVQGRTDAQLQDILQRAGFAVSFRYTRGINDATTAVTFENIGLIKSIGSQYLTDVQGSVMRSVQMGRDLGSLRDEIVDRYGKSKKRAAFIARDQNNKATAVIDRARKKSLGITQAKWLHSRGGKEPRKSHEDANGEVYDVDKGCLIDGEYIMPGELPNCRCVSQAVIPGWDDE